MANQIIRVEGLCKEIKGKEILKNVTFSVKEGSITGLLGPNGSGKTTIIRLLSGVIEPSSGDIRVMDQNPLTNGEEIRKKSGIVTETTSLYEEMTAWENLHVFLKNLRCPGFKKIRRTTGSVWNVGA